MESSDHKTLTLNSPAVDDMLEAIPASPVATSEGRAWEGFKVLRFRNFGHGSPEVEAPPVNNHLLLVCLGHTQQLDQRLDGHFNEGLLTKGSATVVPAGQRSEWRWKRPIGDKDILHLYLDPTLVGNVAEEVGVDPDGVEILAALGDRDLQAERIGMSLLSELETEGLIGGDLYAESLANQLAVHLLRHHSSLGRRGAVSISQEPAMSGLPKASLGRVTDYIGDNLAEGVSLDEMAREARVSPRHFSRLFKESTGLAPHQYVIHQRVERAKDSLLRGYSVSEVAQGVGFADQSHLSRHFKRLVGVTPRQFR